MARIRTVKPEFWTDGTMVRLSPWARLLYIGSWNFALCDYGHLPDDAMGLKLKILPADPVDPDELVEELVKFGRLIRKVTSDGRSYLHILRFADHQKVDTRWQSRCPYCLDEAQHPRGGAQEPPPPSQNHVGSNPNSPNHAEPHRNSPSLTGTHASLDEPHAGDGESRPNSPLERKGKERKGKNYSSPPASPPGDTDEPPHGRDEDESDALPGMPDPPSLPKKPKPGSDEDPEFCEFWDIYPRRVSKEDARKAWAKAVKDIAPFVIIAGAKKYRDLVRRERREPKHIKHPATWLNGQCWNDEIDDTGGAPGGHRPYTNPADQSVYLGEIG